MTAENPFKYFKTSPKIIRLAVMYYVRYPLVSAKLKISYMNAALISVMHCPQGIAISNIPRGKLYGSGLIGLVQNLLRKFERRGRVNTQTGNGI